jgi:hypothetical protein
VAITYCWKFILYPPIKLEEFESKGYKISNDKKIKFLVYDFNVEIKDDYVISVYTDKLVKDDVSPEVIRLLLGTFQMLPQKIYEDFYVHCIKIVSDGSAYPKREPFYLIFRLDIRGKVKLEEMKSKGYDISELAHTSYTVGEIRTLKFNGYAYDCTLVDDEVISIGILNWPQLYGTADDRLFYHMNLGSLAIQLEKEFNIKIDIFDW